MVCLFVCAALPLQSTSTGRKWHACAANVAHAATPRWWREDGIGAVAAVPDEVVFSFSCRTDQVKAAVKEAKEEAANQSK